MSRRNNLLSIGELSKLTATGIKSLRYYERINILKPAYISPDSGYRYYTLDQTSLVEMIRFCIEMDMPLSEMTQFIEADGTMDFKKFFAKSKAVAQKKLGALKKGLNLIDHIERQMKLAEKYQPGQTYTREIPEKYFHFKPCGKSLKDVDWIKVAMSFANTAYPEDSQEMWEFGMLCQHSLEGAMYYVFAEVPKGMGVEPIMTIPGGVYYCQQFKHTGLEQVSEAFREYLDGRESFLAIETEMFTSKHKVNMPVKELRVICM